VDVIGHLWSARGQRDSAQVGAQCATLWWTKVVARVAVVELKGLINQEQFVEP